MTDNQNHDWDWEIKANPKWFELNLSELWNYKDLAVSFVRRELIAGYQQTIMGVSWLVIQPILTTLFYILVFGRIVKVSTDGIPPILFYMSGSILWGFFSDCLTGSMYSFLHNAHIFNKVYFPRLIVPISMVATHFTRFLIQLGLFTIIYFFFLFTDQNIHPSSNLFLVPLLLIQIAAFGMGLGMMVSVFMAKYRDIEHVMQFLLRLFMFVTPVVYPSSIVPASYKILFWLNPLTPCIELFRAGFLSNQHLPYLYFVISGISSLLIFMMGVVLFKKRELSVMDTI